MKITAERKRVMLATANKGTSGGRPLKSRQAHLDFYINGEYGSNVNAQVKWMIDNELATVGEPDDNTFYRTRPVRMTQAGRDLLNTLKEV